MRVVFDFLVSLIALLFGMAIGAYLALRQVEWLKRNKK